MTTRVLLIDGLNLVRRIFEARGGLGDAEFVTACVQSLQRTMQDLKPSHGVVVWDSGDTTWRHLLDESYKANRSATPDALVQALPEVKAEFKNMGVDSLLVENYEADDVIASMAVRVADAKAEAIILSTDKMFFPLMRTGIRIYHQFDRHWIVAQYEEQKFGLSLAQLADYWALSGDNSNNIKGVPGVGKKTATQLLQVHDSLDGIIAAGVDKVVKAESAARRCLQLVKLKTDVELGVNLKEYRLGVS